MNTAAPYLLPLLWERMRGGCIRMLIPWGTQVIACSEYLVGPVAVKNGELKKVVRLVEKKWIFSP